MKKILFPLFILFLFLFATNSFSGTTEGSFAPVLVFPPLLNDVDCNRPNTAGYSWFNIAEGIPKFCAFGGAIPVGGGIPVTASSIAPTTGDSCSVPRIWRDITTNRVYQCAGETSPGNFRWSPLDPTVQEVCENGTECAYTNLVDPRTLNIQPEKDTLGASAARLVFKGESGFIRMQCQFGTDPEFDCDPFELNIPVDGTLYWTWDEGFGTSILGSLFNDGGTQLIGTGVFEALLAPPGGAGSVALDLGNNGIDESAGIARIQTSGDTNNIFTEAPANELLINAALDWPKADLADALAANGANCSAGNSPLGVDALGAVESCFDVATQTELDNHVNDSSDAHDASAISVVPFGTIAATQVQAALEEIVNEVTAGTDDQTAAEVPFTPAGTIAATDVQAALEEVASEAGVGLQASFAIDPEIDGATSELGALLVGDGVSRWRFWASSGSPKLLGDCDGLDCGFSLEAADGLGIDLIAGQDGSVSFWSAEGGVLSDEMVRIDSAQIGAINVLVRTIDTDDPETGRADFYSKFDGGVAKPFFKNSAGTVTELSNVGSKTIPAINLRPDGSQCVAGVVQINGGPLEDVITCAAHAAAVMYGSINMADIGGCPAGPLNFTAIVRSAGSAIFDANFSAMYRRWGSTDVINSTWSSDVAANVSLGTANEIEVATASVTPNGTCTTGSTMLFFRYDIDSVNHTATTANLLGVIIARP